MAELTEVADEGRVRADARDQDGRQQGDAHEEKNVRAGKKRSVRLRVGIGLMVVALAAFSWWLYARQFEQTYDAQVDGDIGAVSPRVVGTVTATRGLTA